MALKRESKADDAAARKASESFERIAATREKDFGSLPSTSETISCRIPRGEKTRLRLLFARHGLKLSEAIKEAVYKYAKELE